MANCRRKIDPQMRLSLIGSCHDYGSYVSYNWTLLTKNLTTVPLLWTLDTRTPQDSITFVLMPNKLADSVQYFARFSAMTPTGKHFNDDVGILIYSSNAYQNV